MNISIPTGGDRRVLAAGAAVIGALLIGFRGVPAWRAWRAEARGAAAEQIAAAERTDALLSNFSASLDSLEARMSRMTKLALLAGETPADARANLGAAVAEMARAASVRLEAGETRIDTSGHAAVALASLDAQATGDVRGLASLLYSVERGPPLLAVTRLVVQPQRIDGPSDQVETIAVHFTIQGPALLGPVRPRH